MDFPFCPPEIADALGGSVIAEEYRGDFAAARVAADRALERARAESGSQGLADALLASGVVHLLQHREQAALACFEESGRVAGADAARALVAHVYALMARQQRFGVFPGWIYCVTLETGRKWEVRAGRAAAEPLRRELRGRAADPARVLHADLVNDLLIYLPMARAIMAGRALAATDKHRALLEGMVGDVLRFGERATAAGAEGLAGSALAAAGDLCWRGGAPERAAALIQQAQAAFEAAGDHAGNAACWLRLGDRFSAPESAAATWGLRMQDGNWSHAMSPDTERSEFSRAGVHPGDARTAYQRAGELYAAAGAPRGSAVVSLRLGWVRVLEGEYADATEHCAQAERAFAAAGDGAGALLARAHAVMAAVGAGAGEDHGTAREIGAWGAGEGGFGHAAGLGIFFARCGRRWLAYDGDAERALACFRLAETLFDALGDGDGAAQARADQGTVFADVRDRAAATGAFEAAQARFRAVAARRPEYAPASWEKSVMTADELCGLALRAEDPVALERATAALAALHAAPPPSAGISLFTPGLAGALPGMVATRTEAAVTMAPFFRALRAREAGDEASFTREARAALRAARRAAPERRDFLAAQVHRLRRRRGRAQAAFERFAARGGLTSGWVGEMVDRLAEHFGPAGSAVAADRTAEMDAFAASFFCRIERWERAAAHLRAVEAARGGEWWLREPDPWDALRIWAEVHEGLGELDRALERYQEAMEALETRWVLLSRDDARVAMMDGTGPRDIYFGAMRAALRALRAAPPAERPARAALLFELSERGRARALLELLAQGGEGGRELRAGAARLALWRRLLAREYAQATFDAGRAADLEGRIEAEERRLREAGAAGGFARGRTLTLAQAAARLPEGTALVHHAFLGRHLLAWAVTREGMVAWHLRTLDARVLGHHVRAFHRACAERGDHAEAGARLAEHFLRPLAGVIRESRALVILPYGPAHLLPFHALPWQGAPLGATRTVTYLPSAGVLPFLGSGTLDGTSSALAVGNPCAMAWQSPLGGPPVRLRPLPAAEAEAAYIASLFPGGRALLGAQATGAAVRAELGTAPVLHLATHGCLSAESPMLSALLLAGGDALPVHELMGLRLDADLVVLSACETGRGEASGGDEVLGLTRALLAAGARAAVVSLWPVDDESASLLMGEFYRHLREGRPAADALRAAQAYLRGLDEAGRARGIAGMVAALAGERDAGPLLAALRRAASRHVGGAAIRASRAPRYDHPYHWAAFVLVSAP
jgi:CHAT domain-containing protein/tetratricopeptide (TPR) repeat protein